VGTGLMFEMAGGMTFDVHGISGLAAILLMLYMQFGQASF
jgi:hypothetical protein